MAASQSPWSHEQLVFIEWLATPKKFRTPKRYEGLATTLGVTRMTLYRWKKLPGLLDAVSARAKERVAKYFPDVLQAVAEKAIEGSAQHARMYVEIHDDVFNKRTLEVTDARSSVVEKTDEQIIDRIGEILKKGVHGDKVPTKDELVGMLMKPADGGRPAAEA